MGRGGAQFRWMYRAENGLDETPIPVCWHSAAPVVYWCASITPAIQGRKAAAPTSEDGSHAFGWVSINHHHPNNVEEPDKGGQA